MNCANHPEIAASAFCRECGKPMCQGCQKQALGSIYCDDHLPASARPAAQTSAAPPPPPIPETTPASPYTSPYTAPYARAVDPSVHPGLALLLGFAPGVGAIYNGQYAKGLVHAVVFGLMISILNNTNNGGIQAMVGIMVGVWVIYQAFEAYHTARKRRFGQHVEEFSSLFDVKASHGRFPAGAILLIGLGFLLLLDTTDIISIDVFARYWPGLLIALGLYLLYARMNPAPHRPVAVTDAEHPADGERTAMNPQSQGLMRAITGPIILITVGVLFSVERFTGVSFGQTWPVLLIVIGLLKLMGGRRPRRDAYFAPPYTPPPFDQAAPPPPPRPGERR